MSAFWELYSDKILPEPNSGCWFWMGALSERHYGVIFTAPGRNIRAHRVAYQMTRGPIPDGLVLDHLCRVHCCVNPDHLEAVTQQINVRRGLLANRPKRSAEEVRVARQAYRQSPKGQATKQREMQKRRSQRNQQSNLEGQ